MLLHRMNYRLFFRNGIVGECGTGVFTWTGKMGVMALFRLLNCNHFTESLNEVRPM